MSTTMSDGRRRILHVARAMFSKRGYTDVSMQQIADAAGLTKATLYHHFRDKQNLYVEIVRWFHERLGIEIEQLIADATTLDEQLTRIARAFFSHAGDADFSRLMRDVQQHVDEETCKLLHDQLHAPDVASPERVIRACFVQAVEAGDIIPIDPDIPFALFFSMIHGLHQFAQMPESQGKVDEETAALIPKILLHGIAATSPLRDAAFPPYSPDQRDLVPPFGTRHDTELHEPGSAPRRIDEPAIEL